MQHSVHLTHFPRRASDVSGSADRQRRSTRYHTHTARHRPGPTTLIGLAKKGKRFPDCRFSYTPAWQLIYHQMFCFEWLVSAAILRHVLRYVGGGGRSEREHLDDWNFVFLMGIGKRWASCQSSKIWWRRSSCKSQNIQLTAESAHVTLWGCSRGLSRYLFNFRYDIDIRFWSNIS